MKPLDVVNHFGGVPQTARRLGCTRQAVYQWLARKRIPRLRQFQIQAVSNGALRTKQ